MFSVAVIVVVAIAIAIVGAIAFDKFQDRLVFKGEFVNVVAIIGYFVVMSIILLAVIFGLFVLFN